MVSKHVSGILGKRKSSKFIGLEGKKEKMMDEYLEGILNKIEKVNYSESKLASFDKMPPGSRVEYKDRIYIKTNLTPFYCDIDNGNMKKVERILDGTIIRRGEG